MSGKSHHVVLLDFSSDGLRSTMLAPPVFLMRGFSPEDHLPLLPTDTTWRYLAGSDPEGDAWRGSDFDDSGWSTGLAGFGFGDEDDTTSLDDMRGEYSRVYLRAQLDPKALAALSEVQLAIRYDDGFIAYLGGSEVARASIQSGSGAEADGISSHEAKRWELFSLGSGTELAARLGEAPVTLAIEGHNRNKSGNDFSLQPCLVGPLIERALSHNEAQVLDDFSLKPRENR
jgi:hypothetical protein